MSLVLDSSATLAWIYRQETTAAIQGVFARLESESAWVPSLWKLEVANILERDVRRGLHSTRFRDESLRDLGLYDIHIDSETDHHAWGATLRVAAEHQLTLYDAAYLELAERRGLPLATLDRDLRRAGKARGLLLLGE